MGKRYSQLSLEEREKLSILKAEGRGPSEIGRLLGRDRKTIRRELIRNAPPVHQGYYLPHKAHERAKGRKRTAGQREWLKNSKLQRHIEKMLKAGWSPELIAGRLKQKVRSSTASHESIYRWVYEKRPDLIGCLPRRHKQRHKKGHSRKHRKSHIPNRISLAERPEAADQRKEFGHWEADAMVSRASKAAAQVLVERKSRYLKLTRVRQKTASQTRAVINRRLAQYPQSVRRSITYDNGSENTEHERVNDVLGTRSYFCAPYHSWEKGTVENTIGLVRRFIPKRMDLAKLAKEDIRFVERRLNNRPRKCLGFQTPTEVFNQLRGALPG
ncbi:MAG: IS30 family transposase [bacterium]